MECIFAYPGGRRMPLHQALTRYSDRIRTILPRHEQGGCFAAQGYARSTGRPGVCMATSGPGATNLVTAMADAKLDSIPLVAITGQVARKSIGTDAFQETPIVESLPRDHQAPLSGDRSPGIAPDHERGLSHRHHRASRTGPDRHAEGRAARTASSRLEHADGPARLSARTAPCRPEQIRQLAAAIRLAKRPLIYAGGGVISRRSQRRAVGVGAATPISR